MGRFRVGLGTLFKKRGLELARDVRGRVSVELGTFFKKQGLELASDVRGRVSVGLGTLFKELGLELVIEVRGRVRVGFGTLCKEDRVSIRDVFANFYAVYCFKSSGLLPLPDHGHAWGM